MNGERMFIKHLSRISTIRSRNLRHELCSTARSAHWGRLRSSETDTSSPEDNEVITSYMGLGFEKNIRLNRRKLKMEAEEAKKEPETVLPVYMQYMMRTEKEKLCKMYPHLAQVLDLVVNRKKMESDETAEVFQLPYQQFVAQQQDPKVINCASRNVVEAKVTDILKQRETGASQFFQEMETREDLRNDLKEELAEMRQELWRTNYGTEDHKIPPSCVPCGGCGAFLHCTDSAIPGFMPAEIFASLDREALRSHLCQRCLYIQHYDTALNVKVDASTYPNVLAEIRNKKALIVLVVDLMDLPCSVWNNVTELLGPGKPVLVVGNKVDLLPCDQKGYLDRVRQCLRNNLKDLHQGGNVKGICLISAKTGYGVEDLITHLHNTWRMKGDIYLIGCTNVGKSTLFNALLQSDLCHEGATDLVQRATTSVWPGTTLNLLKFPILRPAGWQLHIRLRRLASQRAQLYQEVQHRRQLYRKTGQLHYVTLLGRIGMSFKKRDLLVTSPPKGLDENDPRFRNSHFCYDTPGAIYGDQILDLLTVEELLKVMPKEIITPRTFSLRLNQTLFVAGLGRVDLLSIPLPIHIVDTGNADRFYRENIGTSLLGVPLGSSKRLASFPPLEGKEFQYKGTGWEESCGDVVLSSAGWVSLTLNRDEDVCIRAWTPNGRGLHKRVPAMLPRAVTMRGSRIKGTPAYAQSNGLAWD
ncbi:nitric oxide-associated protein 1-like isoform X2 [Ornithodoros turicata]|uniref:nitric oxide-associated protein 1-like isoform X2 n=1 Tax=Ornithodoros turicata TaxID=34597 RepID=UPI003139912B